MCYCKNLRIVLAFVSVTIASVATSSSKAAELMFPNLAFVGGTARLSNKSSAGYARLGGDWIYGKELAHATDTKKGPGDGVCTLGYDGSRHVKNLILTTFADPSKQADAIADMRTSTRGNGAFEYITVLVKPTAGETKGRKVRVSITLTAQYNLSSSDGHSGNYVTLYLNGKRVVNEPAIKQGGQGTLSRSFQVDTAIGQSFIIAVQGISYARTGCTAQQTVRLTMTAPVTAK